MRPDRLRTLELSVADVTLNTRWIFLEVETEAGLRGVGEASLPGREAEVSEAVARLAPSAFALRDAEPVQLRAPAPGSLPEAAALSALDQALWDVAAQRQGVPIAQALGIVRRSDIPVYANINRRTLDRSPAGFAMSARDAGAAGHRWFKIAPFDEATPAARADGTLAAAIMPGLRRIAAVRKAIGQHGRLMVDCHWRLDEPAARQVIEACAELDVHWVECPLPEVSEHVETLVRLRAAANRRGVLLAGLETAIGVAGFRPFVEAGAYDVMMPDVKYVGGLSEVVRLADVMRDAGIAFSPHNPTGPVCHAVSLHVCAAVGDLHSLEMQFDETPLFAALVGADLQHVADGTMPVPYGLGAGLTLQAGPLAGCRSDHRKFARDEQS